MSCRLGKSEQGQKSEVRGRSQGFGFDSFRHFASAKERIFFVVSPWLEAVYELSFLWTLHTRAPKKDEERRRSVNRGDSFRPAFKVGRASGPSAAGLSKDECSLLPSQLR